MKRNITTATALLAAALIFGACSGDGEEAPSSAHAPTEPAESETVETPTSEPEEPSTEAPEPSEAPSEDVVLPEPEEATTEAPEVTDEPLGGTDAYVPEPQNDDPRNEQYQGLFWPEEHPGSYPEGIDAPVDAQGTFRAEIGETFGVSDYNGGFLNVSMVALGHFHMTDGRIGAVLVFDIENTQDAPAELFPGIFGGGWYHVDAQGNEQSFYASQGTYMMSWLGGEVENLGTGPFEPGTVQTGLVDSVAIAQTGGHVEYRDPDGYVLATISLPEAGVNLDHQSITYIEQSNPWDDSGPFVPFE